MLGITYEECRFLFDLESRIGTDRMKRLCSIVHVTQDFDLFNRMYHGRYDIGSRHGSAVPDSPVYDSIDLLRRIEMRLGRSEMRRMISVMDASDNFSALGAVSRRGDIDAAAAEIAEMWRSGK